MVIILTFFACLFGGGAIVALIWYWVNPPGWSRQLDVINSQYLSEDGKSYDWSKGDLPEGRYGTAKEYRYNPAFQDDEPAIIEVVAIPEPNKEDPEPVFADDFPTDPGTEAPMVVFSRPNYLALKGIVKPKGLRPKHAIQEKW